MCRLAEEVKQRQKAVQRGLVENSNSLSKASSRLQTVRISLEQRIADLFGGRHIQITCL